MLPASPYALSIEQVVLSAFLATVEERASQATCEPSLKGRTSPPASASFSSLGISPGVQEGKYCSAPEYFAISQRTVAHAVPVLRVKVFELQRLLHQWKAWVRAVEPIFFPSSDRTFSALWNEQRTPSFPESTVAVPHPASLFLPSSSSSGSSSFAPYDSVCASSSACTPTLSEADATFSFWTSSAPYFFFLSSMVTTFVLCHEIQSCLCRATSPVHTTSTPADAPKAMAQMLDGVQQEWNAVLCFLSRVFLPHGKGEQGWRARQRSTASTSSSRFGFSPWNETASRGEARERSNPLIHAADCPPMPPLSPIPFPPKAYTRKSGMEDANDEKGGVEERRRASCWRTYVTALFSSSSSSSSDDDEPRRKGEDVHHETTATSDRMPAAAEGGASLFDSSSDGPRHPYGKTGGDGPVGSSSAALGVLGRCLLYGIVQHVLNSHRNAVLRDPCPTTSAVVVSESGAETASHGLLPVRRLEDARDGGEAVAAAAAGREAAPVVDWIAIALQALPLLLSPSTPPPPPPPDGEEKGERGAVGGEDPSSLPACGGYHPEQAMAIGPWLLEELVTQLTRAVPPSTAMFHHLVPSASSTAPTRTGRAASKKAPTHVKSTPTNTRPLSHDDTPRAPHPSNTKSDHPAPKKGAPEEEEEPEEAAASRTPPAYRHIAQRILHGVLSTAWPLSRTSLSPSSSSSSFSSASASSFLVCGDPWWTEWVWRQVVVPLLLSFGGDPSFLSSSPLPLDGHAIDPMRAVQEEKRNDVEEEEEGKKEKKKCPPPPLPRAAAGKQKEEWQPQVAAMPWTAHHVRSRIVCFLRSRFHLVSMATVHGNGHEHTLSPAATATTPFLHASPPDGCWAPPPERSGTGVGPWEDREAVVMWVAMLFDFLFPSPLSENFRPLVTDRQAWASAVGMQEVLWDVLYDTLLDAVRDDRPGLETPSSCTEKKQHPSMPPSPSASAPPVQAWTGGEKNPPTMAMPKHEASSTSPSPVGPSPVLSPHTTLSPCVDVSRKMTMQLRVCYVLKRLIHWQTLAEEKAAAMRSSSSSSSSSSSVPFLFHPVLFPSWDVVRSPTAWENFFIVLETAKEYNLHILLPAMKRLDKLVLQSSGAATTTTTSSSSSSSSSSSCVSILSSRWVELAIVKLLTHANIAVRKVILRRLWQEWPLLSSSASCASACCYTRAFSIRFLFSDVFLACSDPRLCGEMDRLPISTHTFLEMRAFGWEELPASPASEPMAASVERFYTHLFHHRVRTAEERRMAMRHILCAVHAQSSRFSVSVFARTFAGVAVRLYEEAKEWERTRREPSHEEDDDRDGSSPASSLAMLLDTTNIALFTALFREQIQEHVPYWLEVRLSAIFFTGFLYVMLIHPESFHAWHTPSLLLPEEEAIEEAHRRRTTAPGASSFSFPTGVSVGYRGRENEPCVRAAFWRLLSHCGPLGRSGGHACSSLDSAGQAIYRSIATGSGLDPSFFCRALAMVSARQRPALPPTCSISSDTPTPPFSMFSSSSSSLEEEEEGWSTHFLPRVLGLSTLRCRTAAILQGTFWRWTPEGERLLPADSLHTLSLAMKEHFFLLRALGTSVKTSDVRVEREERVGTCATTVRRDPPPPLAYGTVLQEITAMVVTQARDTLHRPYCSPTPLLASLMGLVEFYRSLGEVEEEEVVEENEDNEDNEAEGEVPAALACPLSSFFATFLDTTTMTCPHSRRGRTAVSLDSIPPYGSSPASPSSSIVRYLFGPLLSTLQEVLEALEGEVLEMLACGAAEWEALSRALSLSSSSSSSCLGSGTEVRTAQWRERVRDGLWITPSHWEILTVAMGTVRTIWMIVAEKNIIEGRPPTECASRFVASTFSPCTSATVDDPLFPSPMHPHNGKKKQGGNHGGEDEDEDARRHLPTTTTTTTTTRIAVEEHRTPLFLRGSLSRVVSPLFAYLTLFTADVPLPFSVDGEKLDDTSKGRPRAMHGTGELPPQHPSTPDTSSASAFSPTATMTMQWERWRTMLVHRTLTALQSALTSVAFLSASASPSCGAPDRRTGEPPVWAQNRFQHRSSTIAPTSTTPSLSPHCHHLHRPTPLTAVPVIQTYLYLLMRCFTPSIQSRHGAAVRRDHACDKKKKKEEEEKEEEGGPGDRQTCATLPRTGATPPTTTTAAVVGGRACVEDREGMTESTASFLPFLDRFFASPTSWTDLLMELDRAGHNVFFLLCPHWFTTERHHGESSSGVATEPPVPVLSAPSLPLSSASSPPTPFCTTPAVRSFLSAMEAFFFLQLDTCWTINLPCVYDVLLWLCSLPFPSGDRTRGESDSEEEEDESNAPEPLIMEGEQPASLHAGTPRSLSSSSSSADGVIPVLQRGAMLQAMFLHRHDVGAKQQTRLSAMLYGGAVRLCFPHDPVLVLRLLKKELPSDGVEEVCSFLPEEHTSMGSEKQTHTDPKAHPPAKKNKSKTKASASPASGRITSPRDAYYAASTVAIALLEHARPSTDGPTTTNIPVSYTTKPWWWWGNALRPLLVYWAVLFSPLRDSENESTQAVTEAVMARYWPMDVRWRYPASVNVPLLGRSLCVSALLWYAHAHPSLPLDAPSPGMPTVEALTCYLLQWSTHHPLAIREPCMPNSETHRVRIRLWQLVCALQPALLPSSPSSFSVVPSLQQAAHNALLLQSAERVLRYVTGTSLYLNNLSSVRRLMEVYTIQLLRAYPSLYGVLEIHLGRFNQLRPQVMGSLVLVTGHVLLAQEKQCLERLMREKHHSMKNRSNRKPSCAEEVSCSGWHTPHKVETAEETVGRRHEKLPATSYWDTYAPVPHEPHRGLERRPPTYGTERKSPESALFGMDPPTDVSDEAWEKRVEATQAVEEALHSQMFDVLFPRLLQQCSSHQHLLRITSHVAVYHIGKTREACVDVQEGVDGPSAICHTDAHATPPSATAMTTTPPSCRPHALGTDAYPIPHSTVSSHLSSSSSSSSSSERKPTVVERLSPGVQALVEYIATAEEHVKFREKHDAMLFYDTKQMASPRSIFCLQRREAHMVLCDALPAALFERMQYMESEWRSLMGGGARFAFHRLRLRRLLGGEKGFVTACSSHVDLPSSSSSDLLRRTFACFPYIPHTPHVTNCCADFTTEALEALWSDPLGEKIKLMVGSTSGAGGGQPRGAKESEGLSDDQGKRLLPPTVAEEDANLQRKTAAWWISEVYDELHPQSLPGNRRSAKGEGGVEMGEHQVAGGGSLPMVSANAHSMIVVASLLENPVNIAGLCRCADIFAAERLVVPDVAVFEHPHFVAVARSAERWVPWEAVPPAELPAFFSRMRANGYTIVGIEQTTQSVGIGEFEFPRQSVMVLGSEGHGIPPALIPLLDVCVEIPQYGLVRSLNVHVTGALSMYEYALQHVRS